LAVQAAKWKRAHVIAVASGKHEALLRDLGADQIVDYTKTSATAAVENVDLVIDAVGGSNMERLLSVIKQGGALFLVNPWASRAMKKLPSAALQCHRPRFDQTAGN
jgi:NADPH:quinone reductase-like Zn-dependent oxidoreductase